MTLPNKLTMGRIIVIPIMIILCYIPWLRENYLFSYTVDGQLCGLTWLYFILFILFALASITDFLDGKIARKYNLVTTFGKFADPLADKLLVFTAMTIFMVDAWNKPMGGINCHILPMSMFIIILIREFMVSGIRMVCSSEGRVIAADWSGKAKTFTTMITLCVCFFVGLSPIIVIVGHCLMGICCFLTIYSGVHYFIAAKDILLKSI